MVLTLQDVPKKTQYIVIDSDYVEGTNSEFTFNLSLESNTHAESISQVIGLKLVDFYITQVGESNPVNDTTASTVAKYVDVVCPDVPQKAQMLDERHGQILARIPLERHYDYGAQTVIRDKQWKSFKRKTNYFNPISIQKLHFSLYEHQDDGGYHALQTDSKWYMVLEVTSIDVEEKPINREAQILEALYALINKIEKLHQSVKRLPDREEAEKIIEVTNRKKFSFNYILGAFCILLIGYIYYVNKIRSSFIPTPI
tara:strand:+ start:1852 stop:2619 length:768 start_codon:yes stop_codon:yes gene_type:complete